MWRCPGLTVCPGFCIWVTRKNWPFSFLSSFRICSSACVPSMSSLPSCAHWPQPCAACRWCLLMSYRWWVRPRSCPDPLRVPSPALPPLTSWSPAVYMCSLPLIREPWVLSVQTAQRPLESFCDAPWREGDSASLLPWPYFRHQQSSMFIIESPRLQAPGMCPWLSFKILPCWTPSGNFRARPVLILQNSL